MSLDPRTIAVQGVNVTPLLVAAQGLLPVSPAPAGADRAGEPLFIKNVGKLMGR